MSSPIRWDDDPSFPANLPVCVFSPRSGTSAFLRLLDHHVGVFMHVVRDGRKRRPVACMRVGCKHCKTDEPIWKAYYPALLWRRMVQPNWVHVVGEVTAAAFEELKEHLDPKTARGKVIEVSRGQTNSRMHARLVESPGKDAGHLPATFDVKIVLMRLWGLARPAAREEVGEDPVPPPPLEMPEPPPLIESAAAEPAKRIATNFGARFKVNGNGGGK